MDGAKCAQLKQEENKDVFCPLVPSFLRSAQRILLDQTVNRM